MLGRRISGGAFVLLRALCCCHLSCRGQVPPGDPLLAVLCARRTGIGLPAEWSSSILCAVACIDERLAQQRILASAPPL